MVIGNGMAGGEGVYYQGEPPLYPPLIDQMDSFVILLSDDGKIVWYNKKCEVITHLSFSEAVGKYYWDVFCQPQEVDLYQGYFMGLTPSDFPFAIPIEYPVTKMGPECILWHYNTICDPQDKVEFYLMSGTDISSYWREHCRTRQEKQRLKALIQVSPMAIITLDRETQVESWSAACEQIFGYAKKEVLGEKIFSLFHDSSPTFLKKIQGVFSGKSYDNIELMTLRKDKSTIHVLISFAPLYDVVGDISGVAMVAKDISYRKRIEEDREMKLNFQKMVASLSSRFIHISSFNLKEAVLEALKKSGTFFGVDRAYLLYFSFEKDGLEECYQWCGEGIERLEDCSHSLLFFTRREDPVYIPCVETLPPEFQRQKDILKDLDILSLFLYPIGGGGKTRGFLGYDTVWQEKEWTREEISQVQVLAEIVFSAITRLSIEEALRSSEEYNRYIVDLIPDSILRFSKSGECLDIISSHVPLFSKDLIGKRIERVFSKGVAISLREAIQKAISSYSLQILEYSLSSDENELWLEARIIPSGKAEVMVLIRDITTRIEAQEEIQRYNQELEIQRREKESLYLQLEQEICKARNIHEASLPKDLPEVEGISLAAYYQPAQRMGGDFYWVLKKGKRLVLYLSDVMGHGLDGAMLSLFVKNTIGSYLTMVSEEEITPDAIIGFLTRKYQEEKYPHEYFISIYLAVLHLDTMTLHFLGSGFQDYPLLYQEDGYKGELINTGLPISSIFSPDLMNSHSKKILLSKGSTLLFMTDGLTEQMVNQSFYAPRLEALFFQEAFYPPEVLLYLINEDFCTFNQGSWQGDDDITYVILKIDADIENYKETISSHFRELPSLRQMVLNICKDYKEKERFMICLHELTANAIEHGNCFNQDKRISIEIQRSPYYLYATVLDEGEGFDWRKRRSASLEIDGSNERGRGLVLIKLFSTYFFYNHSGTKAHLLIRVKD